MTITEVKNILANNPTEEQIDILRLDKRAGVQKLLWAYDKKIHLLNVEKERFEKMLEFENKFYDEGAQFICGVDEAGRGPLAGPLVIAAVVLPKDCFIKGLDDSKKLSAKKRDMLYDEVMKVALDIEVNIVSISNIDELNIYHATQQGMEQVISALQRRVNVALIDAMPVHVTNVKSVSIVHGDALSASIAAASIIAKVTRDRIMERLDTVYPEYGYAHHKGYGAAAHMEAIKKFGATRWHRRSYEPLKSMNLEPVAKEKNILYAPQRENYVYEVSK
ncbi:MAG: ribonuclease HII [Phascolarctobacterium sp.]|nr:ribonuclease HII [Phascolarctobacterium sp.]